MQHVIRVMDVCLINKNKSIGECRVLINREVIMSIELISSDELMLSNEESLNCYPEDCRPLECTPIEVCWPDKD